MTIVAYDAWHCDQGHRYAYPKAGRSLPTRCPEHVRCGWRGSGTPFALIERSQCRSMESFFGPVGQAII